MGINYCAGVQGHTYVASNLSRTSRFLIEDLGLKLRKRTVHHSNEQIGVAFFGFSEDGVDEPVIAYLEWSPLFFEMPGDGLIDPRRAAGATLRPSIGDAKGRWGAGTNHHLALHVQDRNGLLKWKRRLTDRGIHVTGPYFRNYFHAIYLRDPDGAIVEIATTEPGFGHDEEILGSGHRKPPADALIGVRSEVEVAAETWNEPVEAITRDMALLGFHHITSVSADAERTVDFFVEKVGLDLIKRTDYLDANGTHFYYSAGPDVTPGNIVTFFGFPQFPRGRIGVGLAHHFTLTAKDENALENWRDELLRKGVAPTAVQDRYIFKEFYFSDPDGHIVSIATKPKFQGAPLRDGDNGLALPDALEKRRTELEQFHRLHPAPSARAADVEVKTA